VPVDAARLTRLTTLAVAVALVARLAFAFGYWVGKPLNNDEIEYLQLGRSVAAGQGFTYASAAGEHLDAAGYGRAPLYPVFVSIVARVTSPATLIPALKAAQSVLGALAVWLLALVDLRYPLQMLPLLLFELAWKTTWLIAFGLPQWSSGQLPPTFADDFQAIIAGVILMPLVIPWGYVHRHYVRRPADR